MKISFLISAMVLYIVRQSFCFNIQVGTVLFTKTDLARKCWSENDKALLRARLVMQDVLPDPSCIDFSKPRAVSIILDYIYACFHIINTSTYGKLQNLMYLALADVVGGYLRAYVLPLTKKSYYAGLVTYEDAWKVFTFYDQIRDYLKTNGVGWAEPQKIVFKNIKVSPLEIVGGNPEACNILYTIEKKGKLHFINAKCSPETSNLPDLKIEEMTKQNPTDADNLASKNDFQIPTSPTFPLETTIGVTTFSSLSNKSTAVKSDKSILGGTAAEARISTNRKNISSSDKQFKRDIDLDNKTMEQLFMLANEKTNGPCECCERKKSKTKVRTPSRIIIPLPILDDECEPHTIAVPFRKRPLRNISKKTSAFILEHYYVAVLQCFISKGNTRSDIKNFNSQFHSWLTSQVYPRLEDEKWYPAFGGILRVRETIKRFGAEARLNEPMSHDIAFLFRKGVGFDYPTIEEAPNSKDKTRDVGDIEYYYPSKTRRYYAFAILSAAAVWLVAFCGCAFFSFGIKDKHSDTYESGRSKSIPNCATPTQKSQACLPGKRAVSFQFLVKFFKKNEEEEKNWHLFNNSNESTYKKNFKENSGERPIRRKESNKAITFTQNKCEPRIVLNSEVPDNLVSELRDYRKPSGACIPSFPFQKFEMPKDPVNTLGENKIQICTAPRVESSEKVQTLWMNPCFWSFNLTTDKGKKKRSWFRLPSRKKLETSTESNRRSTNDSKDSTDKRSSSYSCSEGCTNSSSLTTNYTSNTNLEEKCSSATMEFFENVISRHKLTKKRFEQKSSTKSESDDDSCTSENEY